MNWKIEEAQQKFSEVIDAAVAELQLIYSQDKPIAAVVEIEIFQQFLAWQQQQHQPTLVDALMTLRPVTLGTWFILQAQLVLHLQNLMNLANKRAKINSIKPLAYCLMVLLSTSWFTISKT